MKTISMWKLQYALPHSVYCFKGLYSLSPFSSVSEIKNHYHLFQCFKVTLHNQFYWKFLKTLKQACKNVWASAYAYDLCKWILFSFTCFKLVPLRPRPWEFKGKVNFNLVHFVLWWIMKKKSPQSLIGPSHIYPSLFLKPLYVKSLAQKILQKNRFLGKANQKNRSGNNVFDFLKVYLLSIYFGL